MKETQIQKQLRDLNCFIHKYSKVDITIEKRSSDYIRIPDMDTDRIHITADNPYQMNLILEDSSLHGTIYHINDDARMLIMDEETGESAVTMISDKDHHFSILFEDKYWKNTEPEKQEKEKLNPQLEVGLDELASAIEELNLQFDLIKEDLSLPMDIFSTTALTEFIRLKKGERDKEPFNMLEHLSVDEEEICGINAGIETVRALVFVMELAHHFKYNGRIVVRDELQQMPLRERKRVDSKTLKKALDEWKDKLETLIEKYQLDIDGPAYPLITFELRLRAQSIGTKWFNLLPHFHFFNCFVEISEIPSMVKIYLEAMELAKTFPYNNFELVLSEGEDLLDHQSWLNITHL